MADEYKTAYYRNREVMIIEEFESGRVLIEIPYDINEEEGFYDSHHEYSCAGVEIIIFHHELRKEKIDFSKFDKKLKDQKQQLREEKRLANNEIHEELLALKKEKEEIEKSMKSQRGLMKALRFMDPEYKFIVRVEYNRFKVDALEDMKCNCDDHNLSAIVLRQNKRGHDKFEFESRISMYSDGSGNSSTRCYFFKSKEEAKTFAAEGYDKLIKEGRCPSIHFIKQYGLTSEIIGEYLYKSEEKNREIRVKEIAKKEKELAKLKAAK